MLFNFIIVTCLLLISAEENIQEGFCDASTETCQDSNSALKFLYYDVNPPEGFNLRRDVYMRFAIMLAEARKAGKKLDWRIVLPPWHRMYHWRTEGKSSQPLPWSAFFDIDSLKSYAPVVELHEVFSTPGNRRLEIDRLYVLQNYENAFENGVFEEKWQLVEDCGYDGRYWGYTNVTAKEVVCANFQGKISKLWELVSLHPSDRSVMFAHGEIPLHSAYGTKAYWDCRRSMKFNRSLVEAAKQYISQFLKCKVEKCTSYIAVHWRRQDFARSRKRDVPSIQGAVKQIKEALENHVPNIQRIFIATDASAEEANQLEKGLKNFGYKVYFYTPSKSELSVYREGGVAVIEQIICSHAAYFVGTHESTFSFRIQEEREILGFDSRTTFNRLCPDTGKCEEPSKWTIVS
ncbi:unnamed protein product, partial [Iphiclides podalirius]